MDSKHVYDYVKGLEKDLKSEKAMREALTTDHVVLFTDYETLLENACNITKLIPECPHMRKGFNYVRKECENCEFSNIKKNECWELWLRGVHDEME